MFLIKRTFIMQLKQKNRNFATIKDSITKLVVQNLKKSENYMRQVNEAWERKETEELKFSFDNPNDIDLSIINTQKNGTLVIEFDPKKYLEPFTIIRMKDIIVTYKHSPIYDSITKAEITFHPRQVYWLEEDVKEKILKQNDHLAKGDCLIFESDETSCGETNLQNCLEQLRRCVAVARSVNIDNVRIEY